MYSRCLVEQNIRSFDHFIEVKIKEILRANSHIRCEVDPNWFVEYVDIGVGKAGLEPTLDDAEERLVRPLECRLRNITYSAPISVDIGYSRGDMRISKRNINIGRMPVMLKSKNCLLHGKTVAELMDVRECPIDSGGYFIIDGEEKLNQKQLGRNSKLVSERSVSCDYCKNRQIDLVGPLMASLFECLFKKLNNELRLTANYYLAKLDSHKFDITKFMKEDIITGGLSSFIAAGAWNKNCLGKTRLGSAMMDAIGMAGFNCRLRIDSSGHILTYIQRPIVESENVNLSKMNELPAGLNSIVAIMSYPCARNKDTIVINKSCVDHGFGRDFVYKSHESTIDRSYDRIESPQLLLQTTKAKAHKLACLGLDGIAEPGERICRGQVLVNKFSTKDLDYLQNRTDHRENALKYWRPDPSVVERVIIAPNGNGLRLIKMNLRQERRPDIGNEISSRRDHRATIVKIVNREDMPFNEEGVSPDLIINPHGLSSSALYDLLEELVIGTSTITRKPGRTSRECRQIRLKEAHSILF